MASNNYSLGTHRRGSPFVWNFTLGNGWVQGNFNRLKFTFRSEIPPSEIVSDVDAIAQATTDNGGIVWTSATTGTVTFPSSQTNGWPIGRLFGDLQGEVDGATPQKPTIEPLVEVLIVGDVTRS